jgi:DNA-binding CsgD family transcriptional regulator
LVADVGRRPPRLLGRNVECQALDRLLADALAGRSGVVVLRGEGGVGKSALLDYLSDRAAGWHVARAVGVESEMELAYSALHQLCAPMQSHLNRLPAPQRDALATVFGLVVGSAPDRFLVGLATLTLFAEWAENQRLVCIVDDAQWLDQASAQVLAFVGRRLLAERVVLACAARTGIGDDVLAGLPQLLIRGLGDSDARALLLDHLHGPLDAAICEQIIIESHGNPLALLELPRTWSPGQLAGGFGLPGSQPVTGKIEHSYARRLQQLPSDTRLLVLAAAAEPLGDPVLLHRAAANLGIEMAAANPATDAGLLKVGDRVEFAHPLVRSAAYRSAASSDRHLVHQALAEATDGETDPDRRAWHFAAAAAGPDDQAALGLELSATRALARGGLAAAAAFLQRAVALTADPALRADRALAAAQASLGAGAFDAARSLVGTAEAGPLDQIGEARADLLRAQVAFAQRRSGDAPLLLLKAARKLHTVDVRLSRSTYLDAMAAGLFAGRLAATGGSLLDVSRAVASAPVPTGPPLPCDLLLDGLAMVFISGRAAAAPLLRRAVAAFASTEVSAEEMLRWGWLATRAANMVWDFDRSLEIGRRAVQTARNLGALEVLSVSDNAYGQAVVFGGDFAGAEALIAEVDALKESTGTRIPPHAAITLAGLRGQRSAASELIGNVITEATAGNQGTAVQYAQWANAVLMNGLGAYQEALAAAVQASEHTPELFIASWALIELIEAAARTENDELAQGALTRLGEHTESSDADWALGVHARCRALLSEGEHAERLYGEAIDRLERTRLRPELARARLLYGEWLRRQNRRIDARAQLRAAHELFVAIGMEAFAERARGELLATGESVRKRADETRDELTPQERQIARLARDGLSNPQIGAQLFLSPRTVEWHLRKVYPKLGISSRRHLRTALPEAGELFASA